MQKSDADKLQQTIKDVEKAIRRHTNDSNSEVLDALRPCYRKLLDIQKRAFGNALNAL